VTSDQEPGDTVLGAESIAGPGPAARRHDLAREAAAAAGPVPTPRPEVLARVLDGLRGLPAVAPEPRSGGDRGPGGDTALPLPRRRS